MRRALRDRDGSSERGATLVEYAMLVALIAVVSIGVIQRVQDGGEEKLDESDERVSAEDNAFYAPAASTTTILAPSSTTTLPPITVHIALNPTVTIQDATGNRWQTTITYTILDTDGNGVIGATINGAWTDGGNGSSPVGTCTTSSSAGSCTVQYTKIRDAVPDVTFTVATITGGTFVWVPQDPNEGTTTANCGAFC